MDPSGIYDGDCAAARERAGQRFAPDPRIRLELPASGLRALMAAGSLRVESLRCLDGHSKEVVRRMCLECCCGPVARSGVTATPAALCASCPAGDCRPESLDIDP